MCIISFIVYGIFMSCINCDTRGSVICKVCKCADVSELMLIDLIMYKIWFGMCVSVCVFVSVCALALPIKVIRV